MIFQHGPKLLLAFALAVTLPLKAVELDTGTKAPAADLQDAVLTFLTRQHFHPSVEARPDGFVISAHSGDCDLLVREALPYKLDSIKTNMAVSERQLAFVFKGELYPDYPDMKALIDRHWTRLQQKLGLDVGWHPIAAVAASDGCSIRALPWIELATLR